MLKWDGMNRELWVKKSRGVLVLASGERKSLPGEMTFNWHLQSEAWIKQRHKACPKPQKQEKPSNNCSWIQRRNWMHGRAGGKRWDQKGGQESDEDYMAIFPLTEIGCHVENSEALFFSWSCPSSTIRGNTVLNGVFLTPMLFLTLCLCVGICIYMYNVIIYNIQWLYIVVYSI